jgi:hypothetical protein
MRGDISSPLSLARRFEALLVDPEKLFVTIRPI